MQVASVTVQGQLEGCGVQGRKNNSVLEAWLLISKG